LIVGISEYEHSQPADEIRVLEPENFRALKFAAKDAEDFATFLGNNGFLPDNIVLLCDKEATATNIKIKFKWLIDACKAARSKNPLVIVYFSGHGSAENEDEHYLIPYEGMRNQLFGTAIPNKFFNSLLDDVNTDKLIVFLDCCHAGGLVGVEPKGAKGQELGYDFTRGLGGGGGRIVMASCKRGQESYESDGNGIFTGKLLELLGGESPHFAEEEEIGIFPLYEKLREEVLRAAEEKHGRRQEPQINQAIETTGIVLAINQRVKDAREAREELRKAQEEEDLKRRMAFLSEVTKLLQSMATRGQATTIAWKLKRYVREQICEEGNDQLYAAFDESLESWPGSDKIAFQCCIMLFDLHKEVIEAIQLNTKIESSARPVDRLEVALQPSLVSPPGPNAPPLPPPPAPASAPNKPTSRRSSESELRTAQVEKK